MLTDQATIEAATRPYPNWKHQGQPIPLPAGDRRVRVNGSPLTVPFRIVAEEFWTDVMATCAAQENLLTRAHDAMSRRDPDGISTTDWDQLLQDIAKEIGK